MNIDEYLNNLQSDLDSQLSSIDSQLSRFGLSSGQSSAQQPASGEKKFCPDCGTQVEADAKFCPNCGFHFIDEEPSATSNEQAQTPAHKRKFKVSFACRPYCVQMFKADKDLKRRCLEAAANEELSEFWGDYSQGEGDYCFDYEREVLTWDSQMDFSVYDEDGNEIYHTDDMKDLDIWGEQNEDGKVTDFEGMPDGDYFIGFDVMKGSCWEGEFEAEDFDPKKLAFERSKELDDEFPMIGDDVMEVSCLRYDGEPVDLEFLSDNGSYGWTGYIYNCKEKDWWEEITQEDEESDADEQSNADGDAPADNNEAAFNPYWNDSREDEGIIWTDTKELAKKYGVGRDEVVQLLNDFIDANNEMDIMWHLLDMADYQHELGEGTWMDYSDVLQQYIQDEDIQAGPHLSLFIIGGNDVIPQPAEDNPCYSPSPWSDGTYEDRVHADFYYCFYGPLPLDFLDFRRARCNVARLPLETGEIHTTIEEDLQAYFNISNMVTGDGGIDIGRAVMTSNSDWIPASREMSRNLPTEHMDNEEDVVLDNMFLSPSIMVDMDEDLSERYAEKLGEADMLMFNLHGACAPDDSGFYSTGLAFSIDMLQDSNARVFNTVACWGARYIMYTREQSMLLNAIYGGGVLLYSGACVPALGKCGNFQHDETWRIQPAAYSETFMARFGEYECIGTMTAGEAFLKAKCDYYNTSRQVEEDEYILGTVLMFNLYGNPKLRTRPNVEALADIQEADGSKIVRIPFRKLQRQTVMQPQKQEAGAKSLLSDVRGAVDNNLRMIHESITKNLYQQLGVEPRELFSVERYETAKANGQPEKGYLYNYGHQSGSIRSQIQARVDEHGKLIDAIQTK